MATSVATAGTAKVKRKEGLMDLPASQAGAVATIQSLGKGSPDGSLGLDQHGKTSFPKKSERSYLLSKLKKGRLQAHKKLMSTLSHPHQCWHAIHLYPIPLMGWLVVECFRGDGIGCRGNKKVRRWADNKNKLTDSCFTH